MALRRKEPGIDDYAVSIVRVKARQMVGRAGFTENDREDLEQELLLDLLRRLPKFDPARVKRETFIALVVEHRVCTLLEERRTAEQTLRRATLSLDDEVDDGEGGLASLGDLLAESERDRRTGSRVVNGEAVELRLDIDAALGGLPPADQALCEAMRHESITETALRTGRARGSIYDELYRIRNRLDGSGVAAYARSARRSAGRAGK